MKMECLIARQVQRAHKCEYESGPVQQAPQQALEEVSYLLRVFQCGRPDLRLK